MSQKELFIFEMLIVIAVGALLHIVFPRYEWRTVGTAGAMNIIVYDRWTGRFQRAVYDDKGSLNVMGVYTPF